MIQARVVLEPGTGARKRAGDLFHEHGQVFLAGALDGELLAALEARHRALLDALETPLAGGRAAPLGPGRFRLALEIAGSFNDPRLHASPVILGLLRRFLGGNCVLASFGSLVELPGAPEGALAREHAPLFPEAAALPSHAISVWVPLGGQAGLEVSEGSHRAQEPAPPEPLPADGVACLDYRLRCRRTAHTGDRPRVALELVYSRPWFLDRVSFAAVPPLVMSLAEYQAVPAEHRGLFTRVSSELVQRGLPAPRHHA